MNYTKTVIVWTLLTLAGGMACAQTIGQTFEMRYFTDDPAANGETDFKGETEWMDTEERVQFLHHYADFASRFFNNPRLDQQIVNDAEIDSLLAGIKPQPLPNIRTDVDLRTWKAYGYRQGLDRETEAAHAIWRIISGAELAGGQLVLTDARGSLDIEAMDWWFKLNTRIKLDSDNRIQIALHGDQGEAVAIDISGNGVIRAEGQNETARVSIPSDWFEVTIEGDLTEQKFNLLVDGQNVFDFIPFGNGGTEQIDRLEIETAGRVEMDEIVLMHYREHDDERVPFIPEVVLNVDFQERPNPEGWNTMDYDDSHWTEV